LIKSTARYVRWLVLNAQSGLGKTHMRLWLIWRNHADAKQ
jgi:chromosomal replication initiation ATPase DnaA